MHYLGLFWDCLGENSGQIQVLLAILALILAIIAACYAKNQITLAQAQRKFELKLQLLNSAHEYLTLIIELRHKHKVFKTEFYEKFNFNGTEIVEGYNYSNDEYFKTIESLLDAPEELMKTMIETLNNKAIQLDISQLEEYLKLISSAGSKLRSSNIGFNNRFYDLKKIQINH